MSLLYVSPVSHSSLCMLCFFALLLLFGRFLLCISGRARASFIAPRVYYLVFTAAGPVLCFFFFILQVSDKLTVLSEPALCYQHGWGCCDWPGVRSRRSDLSQVWTIPKKDPSPARSLRGRYKRNHSWRTAQALWNTGHQFVLQPGTS